MSNFNQMQERILWTLHSIVNGWELEWVGIVNNSSQGTVRVMQAGDFRTLLKIEYEFQPERCRLLVYRDGKHILGRCNMDYDDNVLIERIVTQFRRLAPATHTPRLLAKESRRSFSEIPIVANLLAGASVS